jgi:hypothetical protein
MDGPLPKLCPTVTLSHQDDWVHLTWAEFELTKLVVIGTDCIGSYKSNYQTITAIKNEHKQHWHKICGNIVFVKLNVTINSTKSENCEKITKHQILSDHGTESYCVHVNLIHNTFLQEIIDMIYVFWLPFWYLHPFLNYHRIWCFVIFSQFSDLVLFIVTFNFTCTQ